MEFDPICNLFYTTFECCSTAGKVEVVNFYNLSKAWIRTEYILADGTRTDVVPDGLDCSCVAEECFPITEALHSNALYIFASVGVPYDDIITLDGTPTITKVENTVPPGLSIAQIGTNDFRVSGIIASPGNYGMDLTFYNCDGQSFPLTYTIRAT